MRKRLRCSSPSRSEVQHIVSALQERRKAIKCELSIIKKNMLYLANKYEKIESEAKEFQHKIRELEIQLGLPETDSKWQTEQKQFNPEDRIKVNKLIEFYMKDDFSYEKAKFFAETIIYNTSENYKEMMIKQIDYTNYLNARNGINK